jgi:hypothetical protein
MTPFPDLTAEEVARAMFGLNPSQISAFHRTEVWPDGRFYSLSLSHAWSLWAWSNVLQGPTEPLTVIHLDAHADLEIPALVCSAAAGRFNAPVGSGYLDIGEPASVASCLEDGFIGIGGFIVPPFSLQTVTSSMWNQREPSRARRIRLISERGGLRIAVCLECNSGQQ